jgi:aryl-alcohol dehydrogenase-like predicted oxidoreductase
VEETLEALDRLIEQGKVRAIGCSNQGAYGLTKSLWVADRHGTARFETVQNNYGLLSRRFEDELAEVCRRERISLLPYSPLGGGVLTGKYLNGAWPEGARFSSYKEGSARTRAIAARFVNPRTLEATQRLAEVARECGVSLATFAVAWTLTRDYVGSTLIGVTRVEQLDELLAGAGFAIPDGAMAACDRIAKEIRYPME